MSPTRGLVIATAAAFIVGCSVGLMGGIVFARLTLPAPPFMPMPGFHLRPRMPGPGGPGGPGAHERLLPMLERTLQLSPTQRERIVAILDRARAANAATRDTMEAEISRVLTPEQRARWKDMEERFERSRRPRGTRAAWPPDGPLPGPGERNDAMRSNLWSLSVAAMLAAAPGAVMPVGTALAAEPPPQGRAEIAPGHEREFVAADEPSDDLDWLAADAPDEGARRPGMGPGAMRRGGPMAPRPDLRERLNLTDEQRDRLADIRDKHQREVIPIQSNLRLAALDLRKLMRADRPDTRAINAQIDRIATLRASMQKARVGGMLEARAVLTPAQLKTLRESRGPRMGRRPGGPGMGMMRGDRTE